MARLRRMWLIVGSGYTRHLSASLLICVNLRFPSFAKAVHGHGAAEARQIAGLARFGFPRFAG